MLNIDDNGCECLVCTGQTDLYAEIQSYREGCDLAMLLRNIDLLLSTAWLVLSVPMT
jgi:hypothetical protein